MKERVKSVMGYKKPAFWMIAIAFVACIVIAVCFLTNPISKESETQEMKSTSKWDCSVTSAEVSDDDQYTIIYSDKQIISQTGVLSFQNRNNFDIVVHILSEESFSRSVELLPGSGVFMLQIEKNISYTIGLHAEVPEGTEILLMVYDGEKTEIYSLSEDVSEDISIVHIYEVTDPELVDENLKNNKLITMVKYFVKKNKRLNRIFHDILVLLWRLETKLR
ncbi:MAG: hypothetical protein PUG71_07305 [bacterium]|nr:hypothetical protein [bacterium]